MIDVHIHILPNLDDGANSIEEALDMAKIAVDSGVKAMVVTPHSNQINGFKNYNDNNLINLFDGFKNELIKHKIDLNVYLGMEILASNDLVEKIMNNKVIGLNKSRYYLVEFYFDDTISDIEIILKEMLKIGKIPLIAHPERYVSVQKEPWIIYRWLKLGCLIQINKGSIFGHFGKNAQITAKKLLDYRLVTVVASDGHSSMFRRPNMNEIQDYLELNYGIEYADKLLYMHPKAIIENREIVFIDQD